MEEQIKVENFVAVGRNIVNDMRTGAQVLLFNKMRAASTLEQIIDRLEFLEQEVLRSRGGPINLERERTILHITAGNSKWTPTEAELEDIKKSFLEAKFDSHGVAFVATRDAVNVTEVMGNSLGTIPFLKDE